MRQLGRKLEDLHKCARLQWETEERIAKSGEAKSATVVLILFDS
jgi:hypothetical protein